MAAETNKQTCITINGKLTVTVNLKGSPRRYAAPDLQIEIAVNFGASISEISTVIDNQLIDLRKRLLIACGQEAVTD